MTEEEIRQEVLKEERIRRKNPKWVPTLLNGSQDFEKKVQARLAQR